MTDKSEKWIVLRHALGWLAIVCGTLALCRAYVLETLILDDSSGYLLSVLVRSFESPYQFMLLSGWIALFFHLLWLSWPHWKPGVRDAYDQFAVWAQTLFTSFGFLGTVVGISLAIGGLRQAMENNDPGALISGLSTAFDTTFLGLGASITLLVFRKLTTE